MNPWKRRAIWRAGWARYWAKRIQRIRDKKAWHDYLNAIWDNEILTWELAQARAKRAIEASQWHG